MNPPGVASSVPAATSPNPCGVSIDKGVCHALFAFDVGMSIDLGSAQRVLSAAERPETIRHKRRTPEYFGFENVPVRVSQSGEAIGVGAFETMPGVELVMFEFGAIGVRYTIPLSGAMERLLKLSDKLYENAALLADSRQRVERLLHDILPAVTKPRIAAFVEDYSIIHLERVSVEARKAAGNASSTGGAGDGTAGSGSSAFADPNAAAIHCLLHDAGALTARILRAEPNQLGTDEVTDALSSRLSYGPSDVLVIDWNSAIIIGNDMEDVIAVLEYANVELLEMRYLDHRLDAAMERASGAQTIRGVRTWWPGWSGSGAGQRSLEAIAELQVDGARLFEEVNNALKLLGDQYLARVYRRASERLHLPEWDAAILRKLDTIESIYQKMNDFRTSRRLETLEWIVIILIAMEIVLSLVRG